MSTSHFAPWLRRSVVAGITLALATVPLRESAPVFAGSTITVTTTADELDVNGTCSLREAVLSADLDQAVDACSAGSGDDTIVVPAGTYVLAIPGAGESDGRTGDLDVAGDVTIDGAGATVDGGGIDRVLDIHDGSHVTINGLTIRGGYVLSDVGAGVYNAGTLTADDVTVSSNIGDFGDTGPSEGAGIGNDGVLTLVRSHITANVFGQIYPEGSGGGVFNRGTLTVGDSTIDGNHAWEQGGGIWNSGNATVSDSTVSGNGTGCYECNSDGGGIFNSGTLAMDNSTVSDNGVGAGDYSGSATGGGLSTSGTASLANVTIAGNVVGALCDTHCFSRPLGGGVWASAGSNTTLIDTIVSGNAVRQDQSIPNGGGSVTTPSACAGPLASHGYNLVDTTDGCAYAVAPTDVLGADAQLGPLQDNGGQTWTRALDAGSPAIDAGSPTACAPTDQRGEIRPQDGNGDGLARCDIGAFEAAAVAPQVLEVGVDVKPGSESNPINPASRGRVPVAILSSQTFDARSVEVSSVRFGPGGALALHASRSDVNGDGRIDVMLQFATKATGIRRGDTSACLVGTTKSAQAIEGCDAIKTPGH